MFPFARAARSGLIGAVTVIPIAATVLSIVRRPHFRALGL